ncbi:MAG: Rpn family recombination-promoting nuclease/putative transposase [Synergistaceae bacterium]|nr:Rpn family recombination-promoting nuclease/putative transposase [Synergistaceae bacterium]
MAPGKKKPGKIDSEKENSKPLLHLKNDIIFKMVFGDAKNSRILKAFLLAVLDLPEEEYDVLEIMDTHLRAARPDEKLGILDVRIQTKAGKHLDLEIQLARTPFLKERITAYAGKMLGTQLSVGKKYTEMKKVIAIVILDYDLIEENDSFHNTYLLYDAKTKSLFTDIMEIHTLEMRKLPKGLEDRPETDEKTRQQLLWLKFIRAEEEEEIKMLAAQVPEIGEAYEELKRLSRSERVRLLYESREKAILDEQARKYMAHKEGEAIGRAEGEAIGIVKGRAEGEAIGIEKGRAEGEAIGERKKAIETARNLLKMGLSVEMTTQGTGLSEEEVQELAVQDPQNPAGAASPAALPRRRGRPRKNSTPA